MYLIRIPTCQRSRPLFTDEKASEGETDSLHGFTNWIDALESKVFHKQSLYLHEVVVIFAYSQPSLYPTKWDFTRYVVADDDYYFHEEKDGKAPSSVDIFM